MLQEFPAAIQEKDFCVPGDSMLSHSERRNLTDLQETSQWLGGTQVARCVLKSLMSTFDLEKQYPFYSFPTKRFTLKCTNIYFSVPKFIVSSKAV